MKLRNLYKAVVATGLLALPYVCHDCAYSEHRVEAAESSTIREEKVHRVPTIEDTKTIETLVEKE
jgi:hypothetical protein